MSDFLNNIKKIQEEFYSQNKKKSFIKKSQKMDCAEVISTELSLDDLISSTVYVINDSKIILINYSIFKSFANPNNYQKIIDRFIDLIVITIKKHGLFELHLDLKSMTTTAIERYKCTFQMYNDSCCKRGVFYTDNLIDRIFFYNSPSVISILSILIVKFTDISIRNKINIISKENSEKALLELNTIV
jgi:hypothetical protein